MSPRPHVWSQSFGQYHEQCLNCGARRNPPRGLAPPRPELHDWIPSPPSDCDPESFRRNGYRWDCSKCGWMLIDHSSPSFSYSTRSNDGVPLNCSDITVMTVQES